MPTTVTPGPDSPCCDVCLSVSACKEHFEVELVILVRLPLGERAKWSPTQPLPGTGQVCPACQLWAGHNAGFR